MAVMLTTLTKTGIRSAFTAAEAWHPRVRRDRTSLRKMQQAEKSFELKVRRHLASYLRQAVQLFNSSGMTSGPDAEEVDRASSLFLSQVDRAYGDELAEFQHDVSSAYQTPLELGAAMAVKDLPSGYRFQENALLEVDWSLTNPDVVDWASQHSSTLVTNVLETSRQRIRAQLRAGILAGESRDQIAERLQGVLDDVPAWRARLIAQTEVIAAHTEGALSLYRKAEVVQGKRWVDGQPNACPLCSDLNGDVVGLDELFDGEFDGPPRHPGCRCTVAATLTAPEPKDIEYERQLAKVLNSDPGFIRFLDSLNYNAEQKRQAIMSYGKPSPPQISGDLTEAQQAAVDFYSREGDRKSVV